MTTESLVQRAIEGDVDAFTTLVTRYQRMAFAYALTTLGDYQIAEDATQQALLTAWRNLASLREPGRFGGWLRGIVRFECLRLLRDRSRHASEMLDAVEIADFATNVEEQAEVRGELYRLLAQMARLPDSQRVVAQLYYLGDQSQAAVAEFLGLSVSTVNNRLRAARVILRREGAYPMRNQSLNTPSFSKEIGKVIRSQEQTIDAFIDKESRPPLLTSVTVGEADRAITAFISQYLDDDVARLIMIDVDRDRAATADGSLVRTDGKVTDSQVTANVIDHLVNRIRVPMEQTVIPSGIKVVDLFAPLVQGGVVALVGEKNVGKLVVVEELGARLVGEEQQVTVLVFLTSPDELGVAHKLNVRVNGPVTTMLVPVADASPEALVSSLERVDTVIALSGDLAREGLYPAIDPIVSRSLSVEASSAMSRARELLRDHPEDKRAQLLRAYLTQPFIVAEPYTGRPGITVQPESAESDLALILDGDVTNLEPDALMMRGSLHATN